jgi:hypothetical protein
MVGINIRGNPKGIPPMHSPSHIAVSPARPIPNMQKWCNRNRMKKGKGGILCSTALQLSHQASKQASKQKKDREPNCVERIPSQSGQEREPETPPENANM